MSQYKAGGIFEDRNNQINFSLSVISFIEENVMIFYAPQLNITGYGRNELEAKESFEATLNEFFSYTLHKKTLIHELEELGWKIRSKKKNPICIPPVFESQVSKNPQLSELMSSGRVIKKFNHQVSVPSFA